MMADRLLPEEAIVLRAFLDDLDARGYLYAEQSIGDCYLSGERVSAEPPVWRVSVRRRGLFLEPDSLALGLEGLWLEGPDDGSRRFRVRRVFAEGERP
jgi:hypothetical protein